MSGKQNTCTVCHKIVQGDKEYLKSHMLIKHERELTKQPSIGSSLKWKTVADNRCKSEAISSMYRIGNSQNTCTLCHKSVNGDENYLKSHMFIQHGKQRDQLKSDNSQLYNNSLPTEHRLVRKISARYISQNICTICKKNVHGDANHLKSHMVIQHGQQTKQQIQSSVDKLYMFTEPAFEGSLVQISSEPQMRNIQTTCILCHKSVKGDGNFLKSHIFIQHGQQTDQLQSYDDQHDKNYSQSYPGSILPVSTRYSSQTIQIDNDELNNYTKQTGLVSPAKISFENGSKNILNTCTHCQKIVNGDENFLKIHMLIKHGQHTTKLQSLSDQQHDHGSDDVTLRNNLQSSKEANSVQTTQMMADTPKKPYKCIKCGQTFSRVGTLRYHERIHKKAKGQRLYSCTKCKKAFVKDKSLQMHVLNHTDVKQYKCKMCELVFFNRREQKQHEINHHGYQTLGCNLCLYTCLFRKELNLHQLVHTRNKKHKCVECLKFFGQASSLRLHKLTHTDEKPFKCTYCGFSSRYKPQLKEHTRFHTGEKLFKCIDCELSFTHEHLRDNHMLKHTGKKLYTCLVCEKMFTRASWLNAHKCKGEPVKYQISVPFAPMLAYSERI